MSLSAFVAGELARIATRPTNEEVVARLREYDRSEGPSAEEIVAAVSAGRR
jgi:antitoxin FitA